MCQYCTTMTDGWTALLEYDDVYQETRRNAATESTYGFHESWEDLRGQLTQ